MREIKFRAWDSESKAWFPFDRDGWVNVHQDGSIIHGHDNEPCFDDDCKLSLEVMQFTGLKDKNGKDVWEGDILLKKFYADDVDGKKLIVRFGNGIMDSGVYNYMGFYFEGLDGDQSDEENQYLWKPEDGLWAEVIGNIYENPELLNV